MAWRWSGSKDILVADDDAGIRFAVSDALTTVGYQVRSVADGTEVLRAVAEKAPALIILDVMMPKMDGLTALGHLKSNEATKDIPVVMLTALGTLGDVDRAVQRGAADYIPKPYSLEKLISTVRRFLPAG